MLTFEIFIFFQFITFHLENKFKQMQQIHCNTHSMQKVELLLLFVVRLCNPRIESGSNPQPPTSSVNSQLDSFY